MAIVLGAMFLVLTVAIAGQASTGMARSDGFTGLDQVGAFILFSTILRALSWRGASTPRTTHATYRSNTSRSRVFWLTLPG